MLLRFVRANISLLWCTAAKLSILPENRPDERERSLWQQQPRKYPRATRKPKTPPRYLLYRPENRGWRVKLPLKRLNSSPGQKDTVSLCVTLPEKCRRQCQT